MTIKECLPNPELIALGAFYQVEQDNGIGFFYIKDRSPINIKKWADILESSYEPIYNALLQEFGTKDKAIKFIKGQLEYYIKKYWWEVAPEFKGKQPLGVKFNITYNEGLVKIASLIMSNIYMLTKFNAIPNDDSNGMLYNYMSK